MKKILIIIGLFAIICCQFVFAANTGSAIMPHIHSKPPYFASFVYITNITDSTISVKVTIYNNNGDILTNQTGTYLNAGNVNNLSFNVSDASATFDLAPNATGWISVENINLLGHGIIQWSQDSKATKGLVAHAIMRRYVSNTNEYAMAAIPINNGSPF